METREARGHQPIEWEEMDVVKFLAAGSFVSVTCDLVLYPFDLIKTRMQVQGLQACSFSHYNSTWSAIRDIRRLEGHRGLYKGFGVTVVGSLPAEVLYYTTYEYGKSAIKRAYRALQAKRTWLPEATTMEPAIQMATGAMAEAVSATIWIPCDVLQQKLMVQGSLQAPRYGGAYDAARQVWKQDGVRGFYRGSWATLLTFASYSAFTWPTYEGTKKLLSRQLPADGEERERHPDDIDGRMVGVHFVSGFVSGALSAALTNPLDVVKTRLQVQDYYSQAEGQRGPRYNSTAKMFRGILRDEGWRAFGKGVVPRMLYNSQIGALTFVMYEFVKKFAKIDLSDD